jgi:hypothetical protein
MNSCRFVKPLILGAIAIHSIAFADENPPRLGSHRTPDERAQLAVSAMTLSEKIGLLASGSPPQSTHDYWGSSMSRGDIGSPIRAKRRSEVPCNKRSVLSL